MIYSTKSGINLTINPISNIYIFEIVEKSTPPLPLPPLVTLEDGQEIENTFSEIYQNSLQIYEIQRNTIAFEAILAHCISFDDRLLEDVAWKYLERKLKLTNQNTNNRKLDFLSNILTSDDKFVITRNSILNELDVYDTFKSIDAFRGGVNIKQHPLKNNIKMDLQFLDIEVFGIPLVHPLDEYQACLDSNLSWLEWINCKITNKEKANTIAMHRMNKLYAAHQDDIVQIESERKGKK